MRYGAKFQENENSSQVSLFGDASDVQIAEPTVPPCEEWSTMEKLAKEKEVVGIYISGHPLDDFKFEMKYFCNSKLENLKNLNNFVGKTLTFAGIVTNVQYKTAKNGKDWAMFTLEGYDESHEFRIFDEEYLKFRHFLVNNQFVYFKVTVKDGWVNRETGKKSDPRIQFMDVKQLQDVLPQFAKKLSIQMDIHELQTEFIHQLNQLFTTNKGDHTVTFEVMEFEKVLKPIEPLPKVVVDEELIADSDNTEEVVMDIPVVEEQVQIATRVSLPSRKLKIRISNELLTELEKMNVKFSLN
jgi:DNA polymerase-3 subunit alpha